MTHFVVLRDSYDIKVKELRSVTILRDKKVTQYETISHSRNSDGN